ncbi:MAG: hypothetical protein ACLP01_32060 [Solirubrobacteraceae bacterium]
MSPPAQTPQRPDLESAAKTIARDGRDALVQRLRDAYREAATTHADLLKLDDERLEAMVQRAADQADGLQWRRALASVGAQQLGIPVARALTHPAVARAQELVGAPSYERELETLSQQTGAWRPPSEDDPGPGSSPGQATPGDGAQEARAVSEPEGDDGAPGTATTATTGAGAAGATAAGAAGADLAVDADPGARAIAADPVFAGAGQAPPDEHDESADPAASADPVFAGAGDARAGGDDDAGTGATAAAGTAAATGAERASTGTDTETDEDEDEDAATDEGPAGEDEGDDEEDDNPPNGRLQRLIDSLPAFQPAEVRLHAIHLSGVADLPADHRIELRVSADGLDLIEANDTIVGRLGWEEIEELFVPGPLTRRERRRPVTRLVVQTRQGDASFEVEELSREILRDRLRPLLAYFHQS